VCEDLKDPFRVVDISGDVLKGDTARLGRRILGDVADRRPRVVRVRPPARSRPPRSRT
jgi:DNA polymerase-3 subunit delta